MSPARCKPECESTLVTLCMLHASKLWCQYPCWRCTLQRLLEPRSPKKRTLKCSGRVSQIASIEIQRGKWLWLQIIDISWYLYLNWMVYIIFCKKHLKPMQQVKNLVGRAIPAGPGSLEPLCSSAGNSWCSTARAYYIWKPGDYLKSMFSKFRIPACLTSTPGWKFCAPSGPLFSCTWFRRSKCAGVWVWLLKISIEVAIH